MPLARPLLLASVAVLSIAVAAPAHSANRLVEVDVEIDGKNGVRGIDEATAVVVAPDGRHVYVVSHRPPGAIAVFARDESSGTLAFIESHEDTPGGPLLGTSLSVDISPDGKHVYVAAYDAPAVTVFERDIASGSLTFVESVLSQVAGFYLDEVWSVRVSPDGANVYAAAYGADQLVVFARSAGTGRLTFVQKVREGDPGISGLEEPVTMVLTPDGSQMYVIGADSSSVVLFDRAPGTGLLTLVEVVATPYAPHSIDLSSDGGHVYVLGTEHPNVNDDEVLAIYDRDLVSGQLTQTGLVSAGVAGANLTTLDAAVSLDPSGSVLMLVRPYRSKLSAFARDAVSGGLTLLDEADGFLTNLVRSHHISGPVNGRFDPTGDTYYAASIHLDSVTVFRFTTVECSASPLACHEPQAPRGSSLAIRDRDPDESDTLKWKWAKGATATDLADFGDPATQRTDYALCLYDGTGLLREHLVAASSECKGKPCWRAGGGGFRFSHREAMPDGLRGIRLEAGPVGGGSIKVGGKGALLDLPTLPLAAPVAVQLQAANGQCWAATFSTPSVNGSGRFKGKSD